MILPLSKSLCSRLLIASTETRSVLQFCKIVNYAGSHLSLLPPCLPALLKCVAERIQRRIHRVLALQDDNEKMILIRMETAEADRVHHHGNNNNSNVVDYSTNNQSAVLLSMMMTTAVAMAMRMKSNTKEQRQIRLDH